MPADRVYLNDIEIGSLPSGTYDGVVAEAKRDYRLYLLQAWIAVKAFWIIAGITFFAVPVMFLLMLSWMLVFYPDTLLANWAYVASSPKDAIVDAIRPLFIAFWVMPTILVVSFSISAKKNWFGFYNCFQHRINHELRRLLEAPAEGRVTVIRSENSDDKQ